MGRWLGMLMILLAMVVPAQAADWCKIKGGNAGNADFATKGTVEFYKDDGGLKSESDYCYPDMRTLNEWTCDGNQAKSYEHDCVESPVKKEPYPTICYNGACGVSAKDDPDNDGVPNGVKNFDICPTIYSPFKLDSNGKLYQPDDDGDGVGNACDNCPAVANKSQANSDGDSFGDECDACPNTPNKTPAECQCGVPDDESNYLIAGAQDSCLTFNQIIEKMCEDGNFTYNKTLFCPQFYKCNQTSAGAVCLLDTTDTDGDGTPDYKDPCPNDPTDKCQDSPPETGGGSSGKKDDNGCDEQPKVTSNLQPELSTANLYAVAGSQARWWVAGEGGNIAAAFPGKPPNWIASPWLTSATWPESNDLRAITSLWSPDGQIIFAGTLSGHLFKAEKKGSSWIWTPIGPKGLNDATAFPSSIYGIHGLSANDFWVVGAKGLLMHFTDSSWEAAKNDVAKNITANPFTCYVFGDRLKLFVKRECTKPNILASESMIGANWRAVAVAPDGSVTAVGENGKIVSKASYPVGKFSNLWIARNLPEPLTLRAVWSDGKNTITGGSQGKIWCSSGGDYQECGPLGLPVEASIMGIAGDSVEQLQVVGSHSIALSRINNQWNTIPLPFPNSLTGIAVAGKSIVASAINGAIYTFEPDGKFQSIAAIVKDNNYHPEWTQTTWKAFQGSLSEFWVAGEDLAIAHYKNSNWELLYSDQSVVPFVDKSKQNSWRDLYRTGDGALYAVGNADYLLHGQQSANGSMTWQQIPFSVSAIASPQMQTVRAGPNSKVLIAGNLGVFLYDPQTPNASPVAITEMPTPIAVAAYGGAPPVVSVVTADSTLTSPAGAGTWNWQSASLGNGFEPMTPEDIWWRADNKQLVVVGNHASGNAGYFAGTKTKWTEKTYFQQQLFGLHPFNEKISINLAVKGNVFSQALMGMVTLGGNGNMSVVTDEKNIPISLDEKIDLYDGSYGNFKTDYKVQSGLKLWMDVDVIGVGSQNAVRSRHVYWECTKKLP